ncbi:MAG TPA: RagB/SusD family nutrient uptake outer membrane protein [Puia sp.]|nr:RagB/SusD family nutrient uptake outer membrane protein [Puia sp.]
MIKLFPNKLYMIGLLLVAALGPSCKKLIDIPANPPTSLTEVQQFSDSATAMTAVAGVYSYTGFGKGFTYNDGYLTFCTGLSSDELSYVGYPSPDLQAFYGYGLTDLNGTVGYLWTDPYTSMYPINSIMTNVAASTALSASFKTQIIGEMKLVRAFFYFNTVNLFGDIPLVISTDYNTTSRLPRTSADSIYAQILSDLSDAQKALPAAYPSSGRVRPNLYTVLSVRAKVQLYRKQWQAAYDAADSVINSGLYSLEPDLNNVFLDGSNEAIWQIPANGSYNATHEASQFISPYPNTTPQYLMTPILQKAFEAGDLRWQNWVKDYVVNINGTNQDLYAPYKYKNYYSSAPTIEDYMVIRLADLYLIRAEAAAQLGKTTVALADLNQIRARAGLVASTATTAGDILTAIMHERQVELFTEWGNRWFDLKRTGTIDTVLSAEKPGWKPNEALYPVPRLQRQYNANLTQNPGY